MRRSSPAHAAWLSRSAWRRRATCRWNSGESSIASCRGRARAIGSSARDAARTSRQHHHAVGQDHRLGDGVGDEDHRGAAALPEVEQQVAHVRPGDLVESGEGLVHQQDRCAERERPHEGDPLLHAARELARVGVEEAAQPDGVEQLADPLVGQRLVALALAVELVEQADVVAHRPPRQQRRRLGHEAELLAVPGVVRTVARDLDLARDRPRSGRRSTRSSVDFPHPDGPRRLTNSPAADGQVDVAQRLGGRAPAAERLADVRTLTIGAAASRSVRGMVAVIPRSRAGPSARRAWR